MGKFFLHDGMVQRKGVVKTVVINILLTRRSRTYSHRSCIATHGNNRSKTHPCKLPDSLSDHCLKADIVTDIYRFLLRQIYARRHKSLAVTLGICCGDLLDLFPGKGRNIPRCGDLIFCNIFTIIIQILFIR